MNRIDVSSGFTESPLRLATGLLVYEPANGMGKPFATVHSVGTDDAGAPFLLAGTPVTREALIALNEKLVPDSAIDYLPSHALAVGAGWMVWWREAGARTLFFDTDRADPIGKRAISTHLPALVFAVKGGDLYVFALTKSERPEPDTPLSMPPFYNTWSDARLCQGSAHRPDRSGLQAIPQWESLFFDSAFTHPNDRNGKRLTRHRKGVGGLWKEIVDGKFKTFPTKHLVPADRTLGDLVLALKKQRRV
jgi:PRTRC genetic system protein B